MNSFEITYSLKEIDTIASVLYEKFKFYKIWIFKGDLGSGKTTFIQSICRYLKVEEVVNSPSFSIIQIYQASYHQIYHIDLYRLKNLEDVLNIGIEDILRSNDFCFIEWGQLIVPLLKHIPHLEVEMNRENDMARKLQAIIV